MPFLTWAALTLQSLTLGEVVIMSLLAYVAVKLARQR